MSRHGGRDDFVDQLVEEIGRVKRDNVVWVRTYLVLRPLILATRFDRRRPICRTANPLASTFTELRDLCRAA